MRRENNAAACISLFCSSTELRNLMIRKDFTTCTLTFIFIWVILHWCQKIIFFQNLVNIITLRCKKTRINQSYHTSHNRYKNSWKENCYFLHAGFSLMFSAEGQLVFRHAECVELNFFVRGTFNQRFKPTGQNCPHSQIISPVHSP